MVVNPQIVKNLIENISKSDRRTYKLGRIIIVKAPQFGGKSGEIVVPNDVNIDQTVQNIQKYLNDKFNKKVNVIYFPSGRKKQLLVKDVMFNVRSETRQEHNLGNVSEGIFAAAIACRFISKNTQITSKNVYDMISTLSNNGAKQSLGKMVVTGNFKSPNKNITKEDDVHLSIELAQSDMNFFLKSNENSGDLNGYITSSVKYANSRKVARWATLIYENGRYDKIEISAEGISSSRTSKTDISVKLTDDKNRLRKVDINVSLKTNDVKQFGQKGGVKFDSIKEFFEKIFGVNLTQHKTEYEKLLIIEKKTSEALQLLYTKLYSEVDNIIKNNNRKKDLFETIGLGIRHYATLDDDNIELVQIGSGEARSFQFKDLSNILTQYDFKIEYDTYTSGNGNEQLPIITIIEKISNKKFITLRAKYESKSNGSAYYRQYLEKEEFMSDIISKLV